MTQRAVEDGRKVLVLTERIDHLGNIRRSLEEHNLEPFMLHGRMSKKQRAKLVAEINELSPYFISSPLDPQPNNC